MKNNKAEKAFERYIENWCREVSYRDECLFVKRLRRHLNSKQIVSVLHNLGKICIHCFDDDAGCQCWNDE